MIPDFLKQNVDVVKEINSIWNPGHQYKFLGCWLLFQTQYFVAPLPFQRPQEMPVFAQTYTGMLDTMNFIGESRRAIIFLPYNLAQFGIMIIMF